MSFKDNLMNQLNQFNIFKKKPEEKGLIDVVVDNLFKNQKDYTDHDKDQVKLFGTKLQCRCSKDPNYEFGCQNAVKWFVRQAIAKQVKRKLKTSRDFAMRTNDTSYNE